MVSYDFGCVRISVHSMPWIFLSQDRVVVRLSERYIAHNAQMKTMSAGQRIQEARSAKGLSLRGAAKLIGIGASTLSDIETGATKLPSVEVLYKMAAVFDVPPRWLVFGDDGELHTPTPQEESLLKDYRDLPEPARDAVQALIQVLKAK